MTAIFSNEKALVTLNCIKRAYLRIYELPVQSLIVAYLTDGDEIGFYYNSPEEAQAQFEDLKKRIESQVL